MQAKTKTKPYDYFDPVFEGKYEVPIDTEINLPDYCADVQRILKCRVIPEISSYLINGDSIVCDGICDIRILYLDGTGEGIKSCDFTKEFSASVKTKPCEGNAVAFMKAIVEHLTCRAINARRVDLHITLALDIYAVVQKREEIIVEIDDHMIEKKVETVEASQAVNAVHHQFSIEEFIPLKSGKPPIENILRREVSSRILQTQVHEETLSIEGAVDVSFLYSSLLDGVTCERMNTTINFSQSIACAGIDEHCMFDVRISCGESSIQPKEDSMGECTGVSVYSKLFVIAFIYKACEINLIDDAYSVAKPVELDYMQSAFTQIHGMKEETVKNKCLLVLNGEEINSVIDIWNEQMEVIAFVDKGEINYRIKHNLCLLYVNAQGRMMYTEKAFEFNHNAEILNSEVKKCDVDYTSEIWEYRITDKNTVEALVETTIQSTQYNRFTMKQLTSAVSDDSIEYIKPESKLLIYYADKGERLWDIAKTHKALLADLRSQNELVDDVINQSGPIIICNR